jgi:5-methyltetrahydropteroyltriglutamate--homocysteine methyltransferase
MNEILRTTVVGSHPRFSEVVKAARSIKEGTASQEDYDRLVAEATKKCIDDQMEAGIDIIADGEQGREDMQVFFAERLGGFQKGDWVRIWGNNYFRKPIVADRIKFKAAMTLDDWKFADSYMQESQKKLKREGVQMKQMFTGPYTMADWSFYESHASRRDLTLDLAEALAKEAKELDKAGCPFIQIDEPALCTHPGDDEMELQREALAIITKGLKAYTAIHVCYGDFGMLFPAALDFPVDLIDLEFANNHFRTLGVLKQYDFTKDLGFGVVDVHKKEVESVEQVKENIMLALDFLKPEQIYPKPDCGLKLLPSEEIAFKKLKAIGDAVRELREEL